MQSTIRLSVPQILEALGDENRYYTAQATGKRGDELLYADLLHHYCLNASPGMTVFPFEVEAAHGACAGEEYDPDQALLFDLAESDQHKPAIAPRQWLEAG